MKCPVRSLTLIEQKRFNESCASVRVIIEHTFGLLKGRWSSLRGLRGSVATAFDEHRATCWIRACVVLHNLLLSTAEEYEDNGEDDDGLEALPDGHQPEDAEPILHPTRLRVMRAMGLQTPQSRRNRRIRR